MIGQFDWKTIEPAKSLVQFGPQNRWGNKPVKPALNW